MTFAHSPTILSLLIGGAITVLDLLLGMERAQAETLEALASLPLGSRTLRDCLEEVNLVKVDRDPFGEVLHLTWRADTRTLMLAALRLMREWSPLRDQPLSHTRPTLRARRPHDRVLWDRLTKELRLEFPRLTAAQLEAVRLRRIQEGAR